ncbi:hypothetical protein [Chryseobacterium sp. HMWF035]|uniref:hypothetical protein n=1 Tax=Chryseobacterium sp. HMWF035 TaxID=2056868 RepID=UPI0014025C1D|nr:hypothetical protein [Chryseobacterium sp. HMWF035]
MINTAADFIQKLSRKEIQKLSVLLQAVSDKERKRYTYTPLAELAHHFKIIH